MLNGIDISSWQGDIDLSKLDLDFVIVKATEGLNYVNPYCEPKVQQARSLGLKWGFYHFASGTDPIAEADWFVKNCVGYFGEGIPVLDFEADAVARGSKWARKFLCRVYERTGIHAMVYMSQSVTMEHNWTEVAKDHGLWVAKYPNISHPGFDYAPDFEGGIGAWETIAIWQYASDGRIDGYDGNLDLNHAYMTLDAWDRYAGAKRSEEVHENDETVLENEKYRVVIEEK